LVRNMAQSKLNPSLLRTVVVSHEGGWIKKVLWNGLAN
jgi:hypothetical protein